MYCVSSFIGHKSEKYETLFKTYTLCFDLNVSHNIYWRQEKTPHLKVNVNISKTDQTKVMNFSAL